MKKIFNKQERLEVFFVIKHLANSLVRENVQSVFFIDRSARLAATAFNSYWNTHMPKVLKPKIYFINPEYPLFMIDEFVEDFKKTFRVVCKNKTQKIALFDTCAHSGGTFLKTRHLLTEVGFRNILLYSADKPSLGSGITCPDPIWKNRTNTICGIFGSKAAGVEKKDKVVCSRLKVSGSTMEIQKRFRKELALIGTRHYRTSSIKKGEVDCADGIRVMNLLRILLSSR